MNRKISLLLALIFGGGMIGEVFANTDQYKSYERHIDGYPENCHEKSSEESQDAFHDKPFCPKSLFFYAGLSGGIERLMGRRSEALSSQGFLTTYTSDRGVLENNAAVSIIGGFLWKLPPLPILMGLEGYFGRGNNLSSFAASNNDFAGNSQYYSTDLLRKFFYGVAARVGVNFCHDYLVYGTLGIDRGQFTTKRVLTNQPLALGTNQINRTRGFNGVLLGLGIEKYFGHFIVGLDLRNIVYRRQNTSDLVNLATGVGALSLSFRPIIYSAAIRFGYRF